MLKKLCIAFGVVALAVAGGLTLLPVAHSQGANRETISVITKDNQDHETDVDADNSGTADSPGDYFIGYGKLWHFGRVVGRESHNCFLLNAQERFFQARCSGTFHIDGRGNLEISGPITFSRRHNGGSGIAIVGGTGDFRDAGGRTRIVGKNHITKFVFHVVHN